MEGESAAGSREKRRSHPQGVPDVTRHPETGSSNAELERLIARDAHFFLSLGIFQGQAFLFLAALFPLSFHLKNFLGNKKKRCWIGSQ